jgi:hypothetical protein
MHCLSKIKPPVSPRVEIDASGAAQRYQLRVLQARDTAGSKIQATLADSIRCQKSAKQGSGLNAERSNDSTGSVLSMRRRSTNR